ncbi:MAG: hypothetical protein LUE93_01660 [Bacteroides sp.]|nr:hypothetical protein [Bacteroides sp.]
MMNYNKIHFGGTDGTSGISYINGRGVVLESSENETVHNIEFQAKRDGNIILNTTEGKAIYKDTEIATVNDVSVVNERVTSLESIIGKLNDELENTLNGN